MREPNHNMERKDRDRAKQAKAAAKLERRTAKSADERDETASPDADRLPEAEQTPPVKEGG